MNKQSIKTRAMIEKAFWELAWGYQTMDKITVVEICKLADIHRSTFYQYYDDVYMLLKKMSEQYVQEIEDIFTQREAEIEHVIGEILQYVQARRKEIIFLKNNVEHTAFFEQTYALLGAYLKEKMCQEKECADRFENRAFFMLNFATAGCYNVFWNFLMLNNMADKSDVAIYLQEMIMLIAQTR
ncbi:MAG: hypothetical protein Q4E65_09025 [Clostridia bacterium]|nr:hypothetical protein [Clostridia bacterium]